MNYKPNEAEWMAYLYGELAGEERKQMERYLADHAEARKELENMKALQQLLQTVKDKEVIAPPLVLGNERIFKLWQYPYAKTIVSVAASLLLLMLVGRVTQTSIATTDNGIQISFGENRKDKELLTEPALSLAQVQQMINSSLAQNNSYWQTTVENSNEQIKASIHKTFASTAQNNKRVDALVQQVAAASKNEIQGYVATLQTENMKLMQNYLQLTTTEQKDYMETLLVDFAKYLQQQRNDDLQLLQTKITDVEQTNNLFKAETEQILTSIISNGNSSFQNTGTRN
jgi:hypothetical protein